MTRNDFEFPATLTTGMGMATITALREDADEPIYQADENHPHWDSILEGLRNGDPNVWDLFDVAAGVMNRFSQVTERVAFDGTNVLWDGDPIHSTLANQLQRAIEDGNSDNYTALAKFWEKLESNPNEHSRQQAYDWLACHKFQITQDGDVVGYKYVYPTGNEGEFQSGWASQVPDLPSAFVNGKPVPPLSKVHQRVGDVVTMPRSEVAHDPNQACMRGLHVGTFDYVGGGHNLVLEVHVNPRDFVSIPRDGGGAKGRVCRYKVARVAGKDRPSDTPVLREAPNATWAGDVSTRV